MSGSVWFSATVEAESLPGTSRSESITDWRIVIAAPLVLDNQLPHKGSFLIWERPKVCCRPVRASPPSPEPHMSDGKYLSAQGYKCMRMDPLPVLLCRLCPWSSHELQILRM